MTTVAAIDCGTNSTRLLVARADGQSMLALQRLMRITRLGQGVDRHRALAPEAIQRTVTVLEEYRQVMDRFDVGRVRMTATSAARDAANRDEFFVAAQEAIGVRPELLDGEEEGRLSFKGATRELDPNDGPFLVVDIGCVRLTERFLHGDPPRPEELSQALSVVHDYLDDVEREIPAVNDAVRLVGLAGTVTTVAAVEIGLSTYDRDRIHHFLLTKAAAEDVFRTLATEKRADRIHNPGLEEARADVIVGGCCVLVGVMRHFGFETCLVSEADILDGLAVSLLPST